MAILNSKSGSHGLVDLRNTLNALLKPTTPTFQGVTASLESFQNFDQYSTSPTFNADIDSISSQLAGTFAASFENFNLGVSGITKSVSAKDKTASNIPGFGETDKKIPAAALAAASLVASALRTPETAAAYHAAAINTAVSAVPGQTVFAASANPMYAYSDAMDPSISLEAFDARNLESLRAFSVMFAFSAAIQDDFNEAFFPTITLSPDSTGLEISIRRTMIQQEIRHPLTGEHQDWKQRNLLDALTEPTILVNEATRIYPQVIIGNPVSEKHFVDKAIIAPKETIGAQGARIWVAPLAAGVEVNIIGAGANERTNGQPDQTDAIDSRITVEALYYKLKTSAGTSVVRFDTKSFAGNGFFKSFEHRDRRVALDFPIKDLVVNAQTVDYITGAPATALSFLSASPYEDVSVSLRTLVTGQGNLQFGTIEVSASQTRVNGARKVTGPHDYIAIEKEDVLEDLAASFEEITFLGYDVKAYYPNTNKRFLGTILDSVEERVRYVVPLSPPISAQRPITATATANDMAGPMNAQRITNSINGVTKILENVELLRNITPTISYGTSTDDAPAIEGFGRLMVRPILFDDKLNVSNVLSSTSSANRTQDIQAAIVNKLRYGFAYIYTESRLQPAIDSINGTAGERPTAVIGTDPLTASYIMVNGDPRILGLGFETKVVVTYDYRFRGKIYGSFVRQKAGEVDVLTHGLFAYIPELMTQASIPFNGAFTDVTQVQNRNLHVITLPVALYIEVEGLEQAASAQVPFPVAFSN